MLIVVADSEREANITEGVGRRFGAETSGVGDSDLGDAYSVTV